MIINPSNRIAPIKEYYFSKKLREISVMNENSDKQVINLGIGNPDLPPHPSVIEILQKESSSDRSHGYQGYWGIPELRNAFSNWLQRYFDINKDPQAEILPLIGSKEGIMHISMSFLNPGDLVLVPNPGYPAYASAARLAGGEIQYYELSEEHDWLPNFDQIERQDLSNVKLMWLNYPHMPTGTASSASLFEKAVNFAHRNNILLCHDNPYAFILNDDRPRSIFSIPNSEEVALELHSLSKAHNMAGWRVGALIGKNDYLKEVIKFKSNMDSGMYRPVQLAAAQALSLDKDWYSHLNAVYKERRIKVFELLELLDCSFDKSQQGLFVWAKIPDHYQDGFALSDDILYQAKVFITPGGIFGDQGSKYVRVSLCHPTEVYDTAIARIQQTEYYTTSKKTEL